MACECGSELMSAKRESDAKSQQIQALLASKDMLETQARCAPCKGAEPVESSPAWPSRVESFGLDCAATFTLQSPHTSESAMLRPWEGTVAAAYEYLLSHAEPSRRPTPTRHWLARGDRVNSRCAALTLTRDSLAPPVDAVGRSAAPPRTAGRLGDGYCVSIMVCSSHAQVAALKECMSSTNQPWTQSEHHHARSSGTGARPSDEPRVPSPLLCLEA